MSADKKDQRHIEAVAASTPPAGVEHLPNAERLIVDDRNTIGALQGHKEVPSVQAKLADILKGIARVSEVNGVELPQGHKALAIDVTDQNAWNTFAVQSKLLLFLANWSTTLLT